MRMTIEIGSCLSVAALPVWTMNFGGPFQARSVLSRSLRIRMIMS